MALQLLRDALDSLTRRVDDVEEDVKEMPPLRREVAAMTRAFERMTTAIYAAGAMIMAAAVGVVFFGPAG